MFSKLFLENLAFSNLFDYLCTQIDIAMAKIIVREILKEKGISIKELAAGMGVTPSAVSQLLANPNPSIQQLERIANVIGVDVMDLFAQDFSYINGYIETGDNIYPVKSREQFVSLIDKIDGILHIPKISKGVDLKMCIEAFYHHSIINNESSAMMKRYGISEVFTLTYDSDHKTFFLTLCKGDGITEFATFESDKYDIDAHSMPVKNPTVDKIMDFIEAVYE